MSKLLLQSISKSFGSTQALQDISFSVEEAEIAAVLGPSGCGKSTLLNLVAGLEKADQGTMTWDGVPLDCIPVHQRGFGLMFQDFALFPHYNVFENIAFGLKIAGLPKGETQQRVAEILALVGLPDFEKRDVNTLSGGEIQRVALARSMAPFPRLLMLDEPLGSLDRNLRERLVLDLREILRRSHQTALYITHDQEEAFVIADKVIVMNTGRIAQVGTPQEIYRKPACRFVASFLGLSNLLPGEIRHANGISTAYTPIGDFPLPSAYPEGPATVLLRPDTVTIGQDGAHQITGVVEDTTFRGSSLKLSLLFNDWHFSFDFPSQSLVPHKGEPLSISFNPQEAIQVFAEDCPKPGLDE